MTTNLPPSGSDNAPQQTSSAFQELHPSVQRWVWLRDWTHLRDIQELAVAPILAGKDVIIAAATAAGKTEAAYLPICSSLVDETQDSIAVLNVSPLKALINDQFQRLEAFCETLAIPVHRWHGDVPQSRKQQVLRKPSGLLLITPESLEALFVTRGPAIYKLFSGLRYVVIDELHVFIDTERGRQLQSLLNRVELILRRRVPRIGLSATLGDMQLAAEHMRPGGSADVHAITSKEDGREIRLLLKGYRIPDVDSEDDTEGTETQQEIAKHLYTKLRGQNNLAFANTRSRVEYFADKLRELCESRRVPNEFWAHHGNLSRELREDVESKLKDTTMPCSVVCTNTLELGIDVGHVESIAQIGSPPSVASLRQRLGRSGRVEGKAAVLRMFIEEPQLTANTSVQDAIHAHLVQSVAMVRLLLSGWCEPPTPEALHLSTLVQQTLSVIAQYGGAQPQQLWQALCSGGPFSQVSAPVFKALLHSLSERDLIVQSQDGSLMLGARGEKIVNHYSFYSAFSTPEEYRVVSGTQTLGTLPVDFPLTEGMYIIFAGRRWHVETVNAESKVIEVRPAASGRVPLFHGSGGAVHDRVRQEMASIYRSDEVPIFLDAMARDLLAEGRREFRRRDLRARAVLPVGKDCLLFPWMGDQAMNTLHIQLTLRGLKATKDGVAIALYSCGEAEVFERLRTLHEAGPADAYALALGVQSKDCEKYHWCLSDELLSRDYASAHLDTKGAWTAIGSIVAGQQA